ncbi:hypothetical protein RF11_05691 [Thelohanellus kitauei]|uniref:Uncharacterized protein n=1 Tax=Thelohanellus kitauei TaxID=669202 RepID=A0A0C2JV90_THEKT|nr:hypothetical protein RF11_05691 [Thelohanellus kitauei]
MENVRRICQETGLFISLEFVAEKLSSIHEFDSSIYQDVVSETDVENFIKPLRAHIDRISHFLENGTYELTLYANGMSQITPIPLPTLIGLHNDFELIQKNVTISQDLLLELINIAYLKRESFPGLDIVSTTLLLYETLSLYYLKILNIIAETGELKSQNFIPEPVTSSVNKILDLKTVIFNEHYFNNIYNKFAYLNSSKVVTNIILPLTKRRNPFKSSDTFQSGEELNYFLARYNSLMENQKYYMMKFLMQFASRTELNEKILEYIVAFSRYLTDPCFNCYNISEIWITPFIFNQHVLHQFSAFYAPINFISPELFLFTSFMIVAKIARHINLNLKNDATFNYLFRILMFASKYSTELEFTTSDQVFTPSKSTFTFSTLNFLYVIVYSQIMIDKFSLSATQNSKLTSISIDKLVHCMIEYGGFVWLRRLLMENIEYIDTEMVYLVHEFIVNFIVVFSSCISSWFKQLNQTKYSQSILFLRHLLILICDFYGCKNVKKLFGDQNPLKIYFKSFNIKNLELYLPDTQSLTNLRDVSLLNFILKLFASSLRFEMIEILCYTFYGLSNSSITSQYIYKLLETSTFQAIMSSFNPHSMQEVEDYLSWEKLFRIVLDFPIYNDELHLRFGNIHVNRSIPYFVIRLFTVIMTNLPSVVVEICSYNNRDLVASCIKYLSPPEFDLLKSPIFILFKKIIMSDHMCSHLFYLFDRYDFSEHPLTIKESTSFRSDFLRHSRICSSIYMGSKSDSHLIFLTFVRFIKQIVDNYLHPNNINFRSCKVFKIYLMFIYFEIFTNISTKTFSSMFIKWKLTRACLKIFTNIVRYLTISSTKTKSRVLGVTAVPGSSMTFDETLISVGAEICKDMYQNNASTQSLLKTIQDGLMLLSSSSTSSTTTIIISDTLCVIFSYLMEIIELEVLMPDHSSLFSSVMIYSPLSRIISQSRVSETKPFLYELLGILLIPTISDKLIDKFSKIFCSCLKVPGVEHLIAQLLQNQSLFSHKILHQFSLSWDHKISIKSRFGDSISESLANFIVLLYSKGCFDVAESLIFGVNLKDSTFKSAEAWNDYFEKTPYVSFPAILHALYKSDLVLEKSDVLRVHERLLCIISEFISCTPHGRLLLPILRTFRNYDFVNYMLQMMNSRVQEIHRLLSMFNDRYLDYHLRSFGSILNIASADLSDALATTDESRVEKLMNMLISSAYNRTSILVHMAKYSMSINVQTPAFEIEQDSILNAKFAAFLFEKAVDEFRPFSQTTFGMSIKFVNIKKIKHCLRVFRTSESSGPFEQANFDRDQQLFIDYIGKWNRCERISYAKFYLLECVDFCLSCMLVTRSPVLRMLYNSDQELLDIVKNVIDFTFTFSGKMDPLGNRQFNILNTIMCLNSMESFLSSSFSKLSVLCLPQNLTVIIKQLIQHRSNKNANLFNDHEFRQKYYSALFHIKMACDKMIKYSYLRTDKLSHEEFLSSFETVNKCLIANISSESYFTFLMDDYVCESPALQVLIT